MGRTLRVTADAARVVDGHCAFAGELEWCGEVLGEGRWVGGGHGHAVGLGRGDAEQHVERERGRHDHGRVGAEQLVGRERGGDDHGRVDAVGRGDLGQHS